MNRITISSGAVALCLLTAPLLAVADHHMDSTGQMDSDRHMEMDQHDSDSGAHQQGGRHYDPKQRAEKDMSDLKQKLKLTAEQQPAWDTYSGAVMARVEESTARMEEMQQRRRALRDMDTASRLEQMSTWLRERADRLEKMAVDTRVFEQALTAEQRTTFDQYWKSHSARGMGHKG